MTKLGFSFPVYWIMANAIICALLLKADALKCLFVISNMPYRWINIYSSIDFVNDVRKRWNRQIQLKIETKKISFAISWCKMYKTSEMTVTNQTNPHLILQTENTHTHTEANTYIIEKQCPLWSWFWIMKAQKL